MLGSMRLIYNMFRYQCFNMKKINILTSLIVACTCVFFYGLPVFANSEYTVTPLVVDVDVEARDIIERKILISNTSGHLLTIYPTVNNISLKEGETIEEFLPPAADDRTQSLSSWIEIQRSGVEIKSGEVKELPLTIRINPNPKPGTYHVFIGFGTGRNRDEAIKKVEQGDVPGTIVTVTIKEKKLTLLKLSKFIVDRFVTQSENQAAVYSFHNPGDEAVTPRGEIILFDNRGIEVAAVNVNETNIEVPSGGEHTFAVAIPTDGKFGKYKAFLSVEYGSTQRGAVQDTSFFYILPLNKLLVIFAVVLFVVILLAWYFHKRYFDDSEHVDDSERITLRVKDTPSESKDHDINLKNP